MAKDSPRRAVVLAGGGARGAYEVGVLDYILRTLSRKMGRELRFDIYTGTSVGALNASWLAATCHEPRGSMKILKQIWMEQKVSDTLSMSYIEGWQIVRGLLAGTPKMTQTIKGRRAGGLLNNHPIEHLTRNKIPWARIQDNLQQGHLEALSLTTTEVDSGRTVLFMQRRDGSGLPWTGDPRRVSIPTRIGPEHALASSAIPTLFPSVLIGNHYYCDGALRENTPVAPALRLGADRVLVVALREKDEAIPLTAPVEVPPYPGIFMLLGKLLTGLLIDPLEFELERLQELNDLATHARIRRDKDRKHTSLYQRIDTLLDHTRGAGLRHVEHLLIRPSTNIAALTGQVLLGAPDSIWGSGPVAKYARRLAKDSAGQEADLLSFLFFDGFYTKELIELGYRDAMARHDELEAFFTD